MVLKVIVAETHAEERRLERTPPINARPVKGGARRINRQSWAKRQLRSVDDDVLMVRVREHHRGEINVWPPRWLAKNVQGCDRVVGRPRR